MKLDVHEPSQALSFNLPLHEVSIRASLSPDYFAYRRSIACQTLGVCKIDLELSILDCSK